MIITWSSSLVCIFILTLVSITQIIPGSQTHRNVLSFRSSAGCACFSRILGFWRHCLSGMAVNTHTFYKILIWDCLVFLIVSLHCFGFVNKYTVIRIFSSVHTKSVYWHGNKSGNDQACHNSPLYGYYFTFPCFTNLIGNQSLKGTCILEVM